ncbi:MAG TPA: hypothetical protein VNE41_05545 [Chitinophagaceae bacterium]|nr:hypothetical protein [Chitinophagaceae bacterium]
MNLEERNRHTRAYVRFRMVFDILMGVFYILGGFFVMESGSFQARLNLSRPIYYGLGALLLVYGTFRIFRGFKHIF